MDEIKARLKEASDACVAKFEAWRGKAGDGQLREALQEAVHELRKVAARIEIELAVSDRKTQGSDPIPIPAHRASRRPGGDMDMDDDRGHNPGNRAQGNRDGNRGPRDQQGGGRPVQIRRPEAASAAAPAGDANPGNDAAGEDEGAPRAGGKRPLSLKRSSESE